MEEKEKEELDAPGRNFRPTQPELPPRFHPRLKMLALKNCDRNFRPSWPELPPPTGTSALRDRNFRPIEPQPDLSPFWLVTYPFIPLPINRHLPPPS
jgi:hypothetical protein